MKIPKHKKELVKTIQKLSFEDFIRFRNNYNIGSDRYALRDFIFELDKETTQEVINEIYINNEIN